MRVVYYFRDARSSIYAVVGAHGHMFYIPSADVILYRVQYGAQDDQHYGITEAKEALDEIRAALKGSESTVEICRPDIKNIRIFDFNGTALKKLIRQARSKTSLETEIRLGIEGLLAKAKRS